MRQPKAWSGIGPAVDAHLARWERLRRVQEPAKLLERAVSEHIDPKSVRQALNLPALQGWAMFAMSYGTVTKDGTPQTPIAIKEGTTISGREMTSANEVAIGLAGRFAQREFDMLDRAVTHYVSGEVVNEIGLAVTDATCDPLFDTDLFTPVGFAVLEEPFLINDLDDESGMPSDSLWLAVRAFGWRRVDEILHSELNVTGPGIELFLYTTGEDYEDTYIASMRDHKGVEVQAPEDTTGFLIIEVIPWLFGTQWDINDETADFIPGFLPVPVAYQRRWFHTFMRFCWQQIISPQRHFPERQERREWERLAKRKELLDYTVLRLRRVVDPNHVAFEGGGVPLDHRVRVRAHWTRQYYPTMGPARLPDGRMNPESHRLIWIESYWKGPEEGPLGAMHSATSVVR